MFTSEDFHGNDGFGDCNHDEEPDLQHVSKGEHAVNALVRLVQQNPGNEKSCSQAFIIICFSLSLFIFNPLNRVGEITLIALGPLTNLALAIRLDDQFASKLKELYIMGGNTEGFYFIFI